MAKRVSKLYKASQDTLIDVKHTPISSSNIGDYFLSMKEEDITYDFVMSTFGIFKGKVLCNTYDLLEVPNGRFHYIDDNGKEKYNTNVFTTTLGIYLVNLIMAKIGISKLFNGYLNQGINKKEYNKINSILATALIEDRIEPKQIIDWLNYCEWFMPFEDIISPCHTEKLILVTKAVEGKKKQLLKDNKEAIEKGDVHVIEQIENELIKYAQDYLKDDESIDFYNSGAMANWGNHFKNMYLMKGAVRNPDPASKVQYNIVTSNYSDGVKAEEYPTVAGSGTAGAYSRGKKTEQGGYKGKQIIRACQHLKLLPKGSDCGTNRHIEVELTNDNIKVYLYNYIIKSNGSLELLDSSNKDKYIGKKVKMRFSSMCKSREGICNKCAGDFLYQVAPDGNVGLLVSMIAEKLKLISMKSFHDNTIHTTEIDAFKAFYPYE